MRETIKYQIRDYPAPLFNPNVIQKEPSPFERSIQFLSDFLIEDNEKINNLKFASNSHKHRYR